MKVSFISFIVGLAVGVLYGLIRVKSPAPPIVALLGLLGMVIGEPVGNWVHTKNVNVSQAASVCLVGESYNATPTADIVKPEVLSEIVNKE
jgi:XapX domain-containing protein